MTPETSEILRVIKTPPAGASFSDAEIVTVLEAVGYIALCNDLKDDRKHLPSAHIELNFVESVCTFSKERYLAALASLYDEECEESEGPLDLKGFRLEGMAPALGYLDSEERPDHFEEVKNILRERDRFALIAAGMTSLFGGDWFWPDYVGADILMFDDSVEEIAWFLLYLDNGDRHAGVAWADPIHWDKFPWWSRGLDLGSKDFETYVGCKSIEARYPKSEQYLSTSYRVTKFLGGDYADLKELDELIRSKISHPYPMHLKVVK